ncbi:MAG: hypothetical protein H7833_17310 [Magnetococcus sp. DMHC-1]
MIKRKLKAGIRIFYNYLFDPYPLRTLAIKILYKLGIGPYPIRLELGAMDRPFYGYCLYHGARLAKKLGHKRISVLEFGVASGRGVVNLEYHAREIARDLSIEIEIYGFDSGEGLPAPRDYRDLPYHWKEGFFKMDFTSLQARLTRTKLVIGNVEETLQDFCQKYNPAPIAAIMMDLDYYSSTVHGMRVFDLPDAYILPRVFCYFDDILGSEVELLNNRTGMRLAMDEFNRDNPDKIISPAHYLLCKKVVELWYHQIFIYHNFKHQQYNDFISGENQQLPLD